MSIINIKPPDLWGFFIQHKTELEASPRKVAENPSTGTELLISADYGYLVIIAIKDGDVVDERTVSSASCEPIAEEMMSKFITEDFDDNTPSDEDWEIEARESELMAATEDFLSTVLGTVSIEVDPDEMSEILDDILVMLHSRGLSVYRPMFLEDEDGVFFDEYPYDLID